MAWPTPFQPLKSPIDPGARACGAQTENDVPSTPSCAGASAEHPPQLFVPALAEEVQVEVADRGVKR
jgi:hypothetical protein